MKTSTDLGWLTTLVFMAAGIPTACGGTTEGGGAASESAGGAGGSHGTPTAVCTPLADLGGGYESCEEGFSHRPRSGACPALTGLTACDPARSLDVTQCAADADCAAGPRGTCLGATGDPTAPCACAYSCEIDADCGAGTICVCTALGSGEGLCQTATCTTDDDCGDSMCASAPTTACGTPEYHCLTPEDQCHGDADCAAGEICGYDAASGMRTCVIGGCGAIGRPFLVAGAERVAPLACRADWDVATPKPDLGRAPPELRRQLADAWSQVALMEHASVAAFARFALELLSLGAPADLVERTHAALSDELRHARVAFRLAREYGGEPLGPGPLDVGGALASSRRVDIVRSAVREGCIGETLAAARAASAAAEATDPAIRAVLDGIAADEAEHAALAWRFVAWAIESAGDDERESIARELDGVATYAEATPEGALPATLTGHGFVVGNAARVLGAEVLRTIVVPCAEQLSRRARMAAGSSRPTPPL